MALDKCICDYGWTGVSCALPDCEAVNQCSNKGECISSDKCRCLPGFIGADCGQMADCSHLANCSGQGVCVSTEMLNVSCSCYLGFTGDNCSQPTCTTVNNCSAHGACVEAEFCKCDFGYIGTDCSNFSCEAVNYCSGKCIGFVDNLFLSRNSCGHNILARRTLSLLTKNWHIISLPVSEKNGYREFYCLWVVEIVGYFHREVLYSQRSELTILSLR